MVRLTRLGRQQMQIESRTAGGRRPRCAALLPSLGAFVPHAEVDAVGVLDARIDDLVL